MSFIKPLPKHWKPADFDLSGAEPGEPVLHISKTVCLLESRCDNYAEYLRAIFREREQKWSAAIDRWNFEECQHGELLRDLCESSDAAFRFGPSMANYESMVSYHAPTGQSARGSAGAELVCRCVVEALASTLYRVLADAVDDPDCRRVYSALAQDEARHFGMFSKMLNAEAAATGRLGFFARCAHAIRRMIDLEDGQIMMASCVVAGRAGTAVRPRAEANWYLLRLYGLYRWKHLRYATQMLLQTVRVRPSRPLAALGATLLWIGLKLRWLWARVASPRRAFGRQP
jgi:hypothetical protein